MKNKEIKGQAGAYLHCPHCGLVYHYDFPWPLLWARLPWRRYFCSICLRTSYRWKRRGEQQQSKSIK